MRSAQELDSLALEMRRQWGDDKPDSEKEADMFAGYLLMPYDALFHYSNKFLSQ